jgi:hypothetical protein
LTLVTGWWVGQTVELGLAGAVIGWAAQGVALRRVYVAVIGVVVLLILMTVVLQALGIAPAMQTVGAT